MSSSSQKVYLTSRFYSVSTVDNWAKAGSNIYNINNGNVAVGSNYTVPEANFDVSGQAMFRTPIFRIGENAGLVNQSTGSIAIGVQAGMSNQDVSAIAIGFQAGMSNQGFHSIAIGVQAGMSNQGRSTIAIGAQAGQFNQDITSIAIGQEAGQSNQAEGSIAFGYEAGQVRQGPLALAIGWQAGQNTQGTGAVAIGFQSGQNNQGLNAIAVGSQAGQNNQGTNSICIGANSGSTFQNSIVINGTESTFVSDISNGLFIKPIDISTGVINLLLYNPSSGKISYNTSKTFVIDHPIEGNKYLVHACLEGPEAGVYYRGEAEITNNEFVEILLPEYTKEFTEFTHHVTPLYKYNEYYCCVQENKVIVYGKNGKFSWYVFGKRENINVEPLRNQVIIGGEGPYRFIY
jgi:hypothetical protein